MKKIILIGSPNSGKSLLFNRLTGMHQRVANYPGITVDVASGRLASIPEVVLVDFPGSYSLHPISGEEQVAVNFFSQALDDPDVVQVLCLIDVTRLEKSLYFTLQVIRECERHGKHAVVVANMMDVLERHKIAMDLAGLSEEMQAPVIPVSARSGKGLDQVLEQIRQGVSNAKGDVNQSIAEVPDAVLRGTAHKLAHKYGPKGDLLIKSQARLDGFFLHTAIGGLVFFAIMYMMFQSIFTWAAPAMDAIEALIADMAAVVVPLIPNQIAKDFVADALFGGIGAFLVFVPQIFVLTFVIGILEDSGYMARAALICHKPLRLFGLTGKSFIPMLSGVACAIPGIYAARSIDSPKKRLLTYIAIPLMPCSARLPVYTLLIAAFLPATTIFGGLVGVQGAAMFGVYFFGMMCGLIATSVLTRASKDHYEDLPFVLEMPPYRLPAWQPLIRNSWNRSKHFVTKAGKIIFTVTVVIWVLGYFPTMGTDLGNSWLGQMGHVVEPIFTPLGLDWRYGVAIMTSFLAREVFVGTLGTMFGIEGSDDNVLPLAEQIQASGLSIASGISLLVFFAIALMCVSTMAILSKESGSRTLALKMFAIYGLAAYLMAILAYNLVSLL
ncbi:MAG: ferrous iron transporter B [Pseudomonadales bacterium]|nr:ferrous iron transporter B [Pseudomonadales bacterium]